MMSQRSKRELFEVVQPRYLKANKAGKQKMLDEFTAATGYHRKYAVRLLKHGHRRLWEIYGRICSKRLHPFLPEGIKVLERCNELQLSNETKRLLLSISRSSIDRCLRPARFTSSYGLATTKPGALLKKAIPVRTFADWDEDRPGFMEIDLVAHCGESTEGQFLNTLTCTDLCTGWTEPIALRRRTQQAVRDTIHSMRQVLPFALLGIDSDNGSEFINDLLYRYCRDESITFTRSRPYRKNDQAHVEQKNWSVVRHTVGYDRWETDQEFALLQSIYQDLRLYINFFQPVLKLIAKQRIGNQLIRRYDHARTPFQRLVERADTSLLSKAHLTNLYVQLNPVTLRHAIDRKVARLWKISK